MESREEIKARKYLSTDDLIHVIQDTFSGVNDPRTGLVEIPLTDALVSVFAMLSLGKRTGTREHWGLCCSSGRRTQQLMWSFSCVGAVFRWRQISRLLHLRASSVHPDERVPGLTDLLGGQELTGFFAEVVAVLADSAAGGADRLGFPGNVDEQSAELADQLAPGGWP